MTGVPAVIAVYPSAPTVPQALLRISVRFAAPQEDAPDVRLRRGDGSEPFAPFAEPPLWSTDRRTLTLLLDPSRQKRGLEAHRTYGFVLPARRRVTLLVDGRPVKSWFVTGTTCAPLDPAHWRMGRARSGSRDPLIVRFPGPVDALSADRLAVATRDGRRVSGTGRLHDFERAWTFVPVRRWRSGDRLAVHPRFEDPCGNEINEPFEHAPGAGLGSARATTFVPLAMRGGRNP